MNSILKIQELSKWFGEVVALNNIDLELEPGVTGLLGPNGAGKSTLIKLILGLYHPSRGRLHVLGANPRNNPKVLQQIGYCPEIDSFYENMTGYEFIYRLNRYWGMTAKSARYAAEAVCERVKMTQRMHDPIDEYSKGMRQRIKIAQALAVQPRLLLLDEPMAGLDPQGREEMFSLVRHLGDEGLSVIISSHILYEIERVTDNVVLLCNGAILAQGRIRQIRDLIDDHPHTITVGAEDPRQIAQHFMQDSTIQQISFKPNQLLLYTANPNACYQRLNELVRNDGAKIDSIHCADDNLQAVFEYLTK